MWEVLLAGHEGSAVVHRPSKAKRDGQQPDAETARKRFTCIDAGKLADFVETWLTQIILRKPSMVAEADRSADRGSLAKMFYKPRVGGGWIACAPSLSVKGTGINLPAQH